MSRTFIYLLVLAVLAVAVYFFVIKKSSGTLNENDKAFAVEDTASIGKIFIADMKGNQAVLERKNNGWMVNNKYEVRPDYSALLLSTIRNVSIGYPVPQAAQKTVITDMASNNKTIEISDKQGKLIKSYLVGGPTLESNGTYMLMTGSKTPFVTDIPGFMGVLNTRYVTDEADLRSRAIFHFRTNEINAIAMNYTEKPDSSFVISVLGPDSFEVRNGKNQVADQKLLNKELIHQYLQFYEFINCEGYQNQLPGKDTILEKKPFCTITVVDRQQQPHTVACYYMPLSSTSEQFDKRGNPLTHDIDRYFALINNGQDLVIIQQFHFGKLFKSFNYFLSQKKVKTS